ncbi:MAG: signal peptidase I [Acidimicrobiales bacterium]
MTADHTAGALRAAGHALLGAMRIGAWVLLTVTVLLSSWVAFGWTIAGWRPVTITSGSMSPSLQVGDVLMISDEGVDTVGQRSIVVFDRDGTLIAHRVFAVDGERLVTKGDANPSPDTDRVTNADVIGIGRLVVPLVGLPLVWAREDAWHWVAVWLLLSLAGVVQMALAAERWISRIGWRDAPRVADRRHEVGRRGIQRVRVVVAVLVGVQFVVGRDVGAVLGAGRAALTVAVIGVLLATNLLGSLGERRGRARSRGLALGELAIDTGLVVLLAMSTGSGGSTWVLLSLPIIEAAVRFRLIGALVHWMLLTTVSAAAKIWQGSGEPSASLLADLDRVVDQLSVLFLVVVPAAYLAEQLIGEVRTWQDVTGLAEDRGQLLVRVAELSRDISRLDGAHLDVILDGVRSLGFDACDMVVEEPTGGWHVAGGDPLPAPGDPGSCVMSAVLPDIGASGDPSPRLDPLADGGAFVDGSDPDVREVAALRDAGLDAVVAQVVSVHEGRRVVLRAGLATGRALTAELVEAFRLLAGQASVALRNDQLLGELTSIHAELEHQALHDALTGLPNRTMLLQRLERLAGTDNHPALLFLDLNGFKPVNDRLGHEAGDVILQRVGDRLAKAAPADATVVRLGGDEFTVLLPHSPGEQYAMSVATVIAEEINRPFDIEQGVVNVGTAIGISFGGPDVPAAELIRRADVAMYEAKHGARATPGGGPRRPFELYRPEFDGEADRRDVLLADIAGAIDRGDVWLAFQPVVDLSAGQRVVGVESLVRWRHPTLGDIASREIVDTARAAGALRELTAQILVLACVAAARWRSGHPATPCFVAVNASIEELTDGTFELLVVRALQHSGLPAELLHVEINDKVIASNAPQVNASLHELRAQGVRLVLDDVGQSTLSLSSLHAAPLSGIKLDRRLVVNAMRAETDRMVLRSVVDLSRRLGHLVMAGGIESDAQLRVLREAGCSWAQGYHLGVPQSAAEIEQLLDGAVSLPSMPEPVAPITLAPLTLAAPVVPGAVVSGSGER